MFRLNFYENYLKLITFALFDRNVFPDNLITACFQTYQTLLINNTNATDIDEWTINSTQSEGTNMMGVVVFAIILGIIIGQFGAQMRILVNFFEAFECAILNIMKVLIKVTPIAVIFIILPNILSVDNASDLFASLGWFTLTAICTMIFHGTVTLPIIYFIITRQNPYIHLLQMSSAILTAFGTASSLVTMPVIICRIFCDSVCIIV